YTELKNACDAYKNLLLKKSKIDLDDQSYRENIYTSEGKAIATEWAIRCIDDIMRTKRFVKGTYAAIRDLQEQKEDKTLNLLYAGTGPFATLVLPLISFFSPKDIQFIFMEINPVSIAFLRETIKHFDVGPYVIDIIEADAAAIQFDQNYDVDIIVTECLQQALERESQVGITFNLLSQLPKDVVLIPQEIRLEPLLVNSELKYKHLTEADHTETFSKTYPAVFTLNKEVVGNRLKTYGEKSMEFPVVHTNIETDDSRSFNEIAVSTEIIIYRKDCLSMNESGLTIPKIIAHQSEDRLISGIRSCYKTGEHPGLDIKLIFDSIEKLQ
ncbi:MAG: hypothetical protein KJO25_08440, partial [Bacteroidia bacterium]|nr:hypothetical protein [Bacteroidia bacterium]